MEPQDLDALLIGALYGELTPAEESRLAAHLESHPTDRGALDDLKSARQKIHDSRIFAVQAEPPQAISALLLQEAHRRAPKRVAAATESEKDSWFARFAKNFMSHPAMAAAAMLVLVLGGAGIVWMKRGDSQFATKEVASSRATRDEAPRGAAEMSGSAATAPSNADVPSAAAPAGGDDLARQLDGNAGSGYSAQLYEGEEGGAKAGEVAKAESQRAGSATEKRSREQAVAQGSKTSPTSITVGSFDRAPKDFEKDKADSDRQANERAASSKKMAKGAADPSFDNSLDDGTIANGVSGAGRVGGGYAQPPPAQTATGSTAGAAPGTGTNFGAGGAAATTTPRKSPAPATTTNAPNAKADSSKDTANKQTVAAPTAPPPPPQSEAAPVAAPEPKADAKPNAKLEAKNEPKRDESSTLLAWAKSEHVRAVALAKNGDCTGAAKVALAVSNRAAGYYSQYMATDRALKSCAQYINAERERDVASKKTAPARATDTK